MYDADSFSNWLKKFFTTGVFEGDCQVTALGSMVVNLAPGYANIMGKVKELENQTFTLEPADGSYPRIDTIVIERNDTDRDITAKLVTGELSGNDPVPTARVWENGVYQLIVAEVYVAAGATEVTQANITDKRSDPDVCGIVAGTVTEMDFSQFTAQFEAYFAEFEASNLTEFEDWFQHMKDQLDTDAAGHLQNEIDNLTGRVTTIENNLDGFKFYPTGTQIVGLISDDSAYTDEDGNYVVWGTETAEQLVEDNPNTYKAVASTEDTRGLVGEDTAKSFGGVGVKRTIINKSINIGTGGDYGQLTANIDITNDYPDYANIDISNIFIVFDELAVYDYSPTSEYKNKASLTYTYSNGIITITSSSKSIPFRYNTNTTLAVRVVIC